MMCALQKLLFLALLASVSSENELFSKKEVSEIDLTKIDYILPKCCPQNQTLQSSKIQGCKEGWSFQKSDWATRDSSFNSTKDFQVFHSDLPKCTYNSSLVYTNLNESSIPIACENGQLVLVDQTKAIIFLLTL